MKNETLAWKCNIGLGNRCVEGQPLVAPVLAIITWDRERERDVLNLSAPYICWQMVYIMDW